MSDVGLRDENERATNGRPYKSTFTSLVRTKKDGDSVLLGDLFIGAVCDAREDIAIEIEH